MTRTVSERQRNYLLALAADRIAPELGTCGEERLEAVGALLESGQLTGGRDGSASALISVLRTRPVDRTSADAETSDVSSAPRAQTSDVSADDVRRPATAGYDAARVGVYRLGDDVYVVKPNRAGTSVYAKKLVELGGSARRLTEAGEVVAYELVYAPGVVHDLRPEHRLVADDVAALNVRYGRCLMCGQRLKDATSVRRMIGPVCWKKVS